ncbi:L-fuculose-phosphate aldolase [Clostridium baratii]|uniref:L-fuculose-phosphate aldolase n=1 Tax=Clostridium baratii TaxID=1561 RepID=UPI00097FB34C|nr:L-fuculose-phosphate aldolase [Clostridium baratii]AQM60741.1 fuculose phosphate aldolase [Clostridium baratii]
MIMEKERKELIDYGKKLVTEKLTKGTGGNLSVFDRNLGYVAITPSGIDFFEIKDSDIVILDLNGNIVEGENLPSSEWQMHLKLYKTRNDINAVIHAHTTYSTVLACLHEELPATHYMIAVAGKDVKVANYATYGTEELAENAAKAMENRKAVLLANHGIIAGSNDLLNAFNIIDEVEYCSKIHCISKSIGKPFVLPDDEMELMEKKFISYGQRKSNEGR